MPSKLYYWVDHTSSYEGNSGVQRVVRCLARELRRSGEDVVFVKWNEEFQALARCGETDWSGWRVSTGRMRWLRSMRMSRCT